MSDAPVTFDPREQIARIDRAIVESGKLNAEMLKRTAEMDKPSREGRFALPFGDEGPSWRTIAALMAASVAYGAFLARVLCAA